MKQQWEHPRPDYYCFGDSWQGGGVFPDKKGWSGNAVYGKVIRGVGPLPTVEQAQAAVESEYAKLMFLNG